jgi:hypothetical protein
MYIRCTEITVGYEVTMRTIISKNISIVAVPGALEPFQEGFTIGSLSFFLPGALSESAVSRYQSDGRYHDLTGAADDLWDRFAQIPKNSGNQIVVLHQEAMAAIATAMIEEERKASNSIEVPSGIGCIASMQAAFSNAAVGALHTLMVEVP